MAENGDSHDFHKPTNSEANFRLRHHQYSYRNKFLAEKPSRHSRTNHRSKYGGSGMQAIFLDSGKTTAGTGVFLPRRIGSAAESQPNNKKSGCSPVLIPCRIVEALNLNVGELGVKNQISKDSKNPEIFLPKEWTY